MAIDRNDFPEYNNHELFLAYIRLHFQDALIAGFEDRRQSPCKFDGSTTASSKRYPAPMHMAVWWYRTTMQEGSTLADALKATNRETFPKEYRKLEPHSKKIGRFIAGEAALPATLLDKLCDGLGADTEQRTFLKTVSTKSAGGFVTNARTNLAHASIAQHSKHRRTEAGSAPSTLPAVETPGRGSNSTSTVMPVAGTVVVDEESVVLTPPISVPSTPDSPPMPTPTPTPKTVRRRRPRTGQYRPRRGLLLSFGVLVMVMVMLLMVTLTGRSMVTAVAAWTTPWFGSMAGAGPKTSDGIPFDPGPGSGILVVLPPGSSLEDRDLVETAARTSAATLNFTSTNDDYDDLPIQMLVHAPPASANNASQRRSVVSATIEVSARRPDELPSSQAVTGDSADDRFVMYDQLYSVTGFTWSGPNSHRGSSYSYRLGFVNPGALAQAGTVLRIVNSVLPCGVTQFDVNYKLEFSNPGIEVGRAISILYERAC
ncbi:hypothetical protein [Rhodococcus sp. IEGM1428]|uniref:hypothetical protein n=1 Tax=Rhodococcus sp. IEGM1428 TaxID=3392191 RepID=UPI003D13918D